MDYNVYIFTDEASMEEVTNTHVPTNCWVRRVKNSEDVTCAISEAMDSLVDTHQLFVSDGDKLYAAVIPSDNLTNGQIERLPIVVSVETNYYVGGVRCTN